MQTPYSPSRLRSFVIMLLSCCLVLPPTLMLPLPALAQEQGQSAVSSNGVSISFQNDGGKATGSNGVSISFQNAQQGSTANSNGVGVAFEGYCNGAPRITQPRGVTVLNNQSATLKVEAENLYDLTFQWYRGDSGDTSQIIEGATRDSLTINSVAADSRINYWVQVINQCGTTNSQTMTVAAIDKLPLIFVPGIAGSTLDVRGGREVWLGRLCVEQGLDALSLDPNKPSTDIVPSGIIGRVTVDYGLGVFRQEFYASFVERLLSNGYKSQDKTLFIFPYDWRKGADFNALRLRELVSQVQETYRDYPNIKLNIVAHSMGGLVARRYILDNPQNHAVEKLITIGSPWLGAPKAINVLQTGDFIGYGICNGSIKTLAEFFPGIHQLLPSSAYFKFGEKPFVEDGWDIDEDGKSSEIYDYNNTILMLDKRYRSSPGITGFQFHKQPGQDDWSSDTSQVNYYHVVGLRYGADTIGQVIAKSDVKYCRLPGGIKVPCGFSNRYELKMAQGDGTVPYRSAYRRLGSTNLNASRAKIIPILSSSDNKIENNGSDHTGMMSNESVFQAVMSSLNEQSTVTARQSIHALDEPEEPTAQSSYYVKLLGISSALISDDYGNTLEPFTGNTTEESPNITSYLLGEKGLLAVAPTNQTLTFTFTTNPNNQLATLELTKGTDIETAQAVRYLDLNLPANTKVKLELSPSGIGALQYDADGDGTFESTVQPTASVSGNAAQDTQAPIIRVNEIPLATLRRVTITATDEGVGLKSVFYSLDGTNFQTYNGAFDINPIQTTTVYAFAEDNVANRSSLVTYRVSKRRAFRGRRR